MSLPKRHHYIPIFYLKPWCEHRGLLCEFSRPYKEIATKWKHPSATGFADGLYTIPGLAPEDAAFVERSFMGAVDNWAAKAQRIFLHNKPTEIGLPQKEQVGWARFLYSLMLRTPEHIGEMAEKANSKYQYPGSVQALLPDFINSVDVITALCEMTFHTVGLNDTRNTLLSSDRPIVMTEGLKVPGAYLLIPISPRNLFVAVREQKTWKWICDMPADTLVEAVNDRVCGQARKFIYGSDLSQLRFVQNRFGKMLRATPFDD